MRTWASAGRRAESRRATTPGSARPAAARPAAALAALAALAVLSAGCSPVYVLRAGWEEARILAARRPIADAVHDTTAPPELRAKLRLVQDARDFADRTLGLDPGDAFTSFARVPSDTLLLVVSAAEELRLRWKTWWFPIVGRVPYKGYFDFDEARATARRLAEEGWDVSLRPTAAFSTLGWLPDPVLSTTLSMDSVSLVETVVHEITHSTFYPAGQAHFNESFANFVGNRGAVEFFCDAVRDETRCARARDAWEDTRTFGHFFHSVAEPLRELYASELPDARKRERKREIFREAAARFDEEVRPRLRGRWGRLDPEGLNNAWVLSRRLYYTRLDDFEALYRRHRSLAAAVEALVEAARGRDPWTALDSLLPGAPVTAPVTEAAGSDPPPPADPGLPDRARTVRRAPPAHRLASAGSRRP